MFAWTFWRDLIERAVKSSAQAVLLGYTLGEGFNAFDVDWGLAGGFAVGGLVYSALTSIASAPFGSNGNASLVGP